MALVDMVERSNPAGIANPKIVLRYQFAEHVRDAMLQRELKRLVCQDPALSLLDL